MRATWIFIGAAAAVLGFGQHAEAQPPTLTNARISTRPMSSGLDAGLKSLVAQVTDATWIGWSVPAVDSSRNNCCWNSRDGITTSCGCHLEGDRKDAVESAGREIRKVQLEADGLIVLIRVENRAMQKVATYSNTCELDAGGRPVVWLEGVRPADSVATLSRLAAEEPAPDDRHPITDGALSALATHAGAEADRALLALSSTDRPDRLREKAIFWLGAARGTVGFDALVNILQHDPKDRIRERAVFALSVNRSAEATARIIDVAKHDSSARVRGQALVWLAQKAGQKVTATIVGAIQDDPDTAVKRQAVFALSQLPKDEGVPKLIEIARTNRNPEVRKQAMFWLGQSHDPRALRFFEDVLAK